MLYYTDEARESAIKNIDRLKEVVAGIPTEHLNFTDAVKLCNYLDDLKTAINKEKLLKH
jgi:hypothetical protein